MPAQVTSTRVLLLGTESSSGAPIGVTAGTSQPVDMSLHGLLSIYLTGTGTITGGTILIEEADYANPAVGYAGTWAQLGTVTATGLTAGAQLVTHLVDASYGFVRVRISAAITGGGSITAVLRSRGKS